MADYKAAVKNGVGSNPCTVTDVEETKLVLKILPIWLTVVLPSTLFSQAGTLFVKQAMTLDRSLGSNFKIPAASIGAFVPIATLLSLATYDRFLVPICRRFTGNPRGITILQRMGIGMIIYTIAMMAAMIREIYRLKIIKNHGLTDNSKAIVPRSIFILLPQFIITGVAEAFIEVPKLEFFYDQAPESMGSLGTALYATAIGVGAFLNGVLLTIVSDITGRHGHKSWILNNLNASRLDYYYVFLGLLNFVNYLVFLIISSMYTYKGETSEALAKISFKKNGDATETVLIAQSELVK
ncbi:protein NRT1/ PTR FAMILY 5.2-like [Cryptomeria japonica]|uniref:protein NRT1/ PTR FAMILY 5.2-like n=1 Tax=Cryptomeria japonica TaxID=3369 RepID=UPI0027DA1028|nr:protein NRT1/ PTR FAMILY 5.2-like [Cryptomeria japonica]